MTRQPINKHWQVADPVPAEVDGELQDYPAVLRQLLFNRNIKTAAQAQQYLYAQPPEDTHPKRLKDMDCAVERIEFALRKGEKIAVYGDYDADGVTATALLVQALQLNGAQVQGYIPNRFDEGYGLNNEALDSLAQDGVKLVITVDCGIRSLPEAEHARELGLDLIISDHHHPGSELPEATAIINPKQEGDTYPDKNLAGVGLAYKIASALPQTNVRADSFLDLVALGTVADLAPLTGENRSLVRRGLDLIRNPGRQGIRSLIGAAGLFPNRVSAMDIGFALGPRLNAAGRLESALDALHLLMTSDVQEAGRLAQKLSSQNAERQRITRQIQESAEKQALERDPDALLLFAAHPDFNPGVVGLAASRLTDLYYRPAIVAHQGEEFTRASCRSIPEFHITKALDQCADLMEHHGGHAAAAGFTVSNKNLSALIKRLKAIAVEKLSGLDLHPTLPADMEIPLKDLHPDLLRQMDALEPTGIENPRVHFVTRDLIVSSSRTVGRDAAHLKLMVTDGWITFDAIAFRLGFWKSQMPERVDLYYSFEMNEFNGKSSLQLNVRDLKPSGGA